MYNPNVLVQIIWIDFTAKKVIVSANLLVQALTIAQNAQCALPIRSKVALTQDFKILKMSKVFEMGLICNVEICDTTIGKTKKAKKSERL